MTEQLFHCKAIDLQIQKKMMYKLKKYLDRIERMDGMIRRKATGPPKEFARRMQMSERQLYTSGSAINRRYDERLGTPAV